MARKTWESAEFASQPTTDPSLVAQVLVVKVAFEEPFFARDHNHSHDADCGNEHCQQPKVIQPNGQSEYKQNESQIDGIATEPVRTGLHNRTGTRVSSYRS